MIYSTRFIIIKIFIKKIFTSTYFPLKHFLFMTTISFLPKIQKWILEWKLLTIFFTLHSQHKYWLNHVEFYAFGLFISLQFLCEVIIFFPISSFLCWFFWVPCIWVVRISLQFHTYVPPTSFKLRLAFNATKFSFSLHVLTSLNCLGRILRVMGYRVELIHQVGNNIMNLRKLLFHNCSLVGILWWIKRRIKMILMEELMKSIVDSARASIQETKNIFEGIPTWIAFLRWEFHLYVSTICLR